MKRRVLRIESLEDRQLLAVCAGNEALAGEFVAAPEPTAAPSGYAVGDVYVQSTIDIDGDGFIGPAELSFISHAWFASDGHENWNPVCDLDGDGFVGPGDYAVLSSCWFKTADDLPDETKSYEIYPSNISAWCLFGDQVSLISAQNGTLTLNARSGELEAVCDYIEFPENLRVTADFSSIDPTLGMKSGIELAVQESGKRYCIEIQNDRICLYYVNEANEMTLLEGAAYTFDYLQTYRVWGQIVDGQIACGVGDTTLVVANDSRLSVGQVGFYAAEGLNTFRNISVERNPDTAASPSYRVGDVIISSTMVIDGVPLDEPIISYEIRPSDISNWLLFGSDTSPITAANGILTIDAVGGPSEAVCDYGGFPDHLRVTAKFESTDPLSELRGGIELAVHDSGMRYYAEFRQNDVSLYYVDESEQMIELASCAVSLNYHQTYTIFVQLAEGRLSCGLGDQVLLTVSETRLSGGKVGFYGAGGTNVFQQIYVESDPEPLGPTPEEVNAALRADVVARMRDMATIPWIPSVDLVYYNPDYGVMFKQGVTYYGVPYSQKVRNGTPERFRSYLDENGYYIGPETYIGSDCSSAVSIAWQVVDPEIPYLGTYFMFPGRGNIVAVGEYQVTSGSHTETIVQDNGQAVMYAAYACLQPGDAVLWYKATGGHVRLISAVDPENQSVYVIEQSGASGYATPVSGNSTWRVDRRITFASLFANNYIPITHNGLVLDS